MAHVKLKQKILLALIALVGVALLFESGIFNALLYFLLVGAIPGTAYSIPPAFMLLLVISLTWVIIFRFIAIETFSIVKKRSSKRIGEHKKRMPKRRFSQI